MNFVQIVIFLILIIACDNTTKIDEAEAGSSMLSSSSLYVKVSSSEMKDEAFQTFRDSLVNEFGITHDDDLKNYFLKETSGKQVLVEAIIIRLLNDDLEDSKHQKFIIQLSSGQTLLVSHNIDLSEKINPISINTKILLYGEYEWNVEGGLIHWTHKDPARVHIDGWILYESEIYN